MAAAVAVSAVLAGCGPGMRTTAYNLDFEYAAEEGCPAQWGLPDAPIFGYAASSCRTQKQHGAASLHLMQSDSGKRGWGFFWQELPAAPFAGHEVELSGWIRTQDVTKGFADLYLSDGEIDYAVFARDTLNRGVRNTTEWTHVSLKKRFGAHASTMRIGGILKGPGQAWFDNMELTIDGKPLRDTLIPAPKVRLTRADKRELRKYVYPLRSCDCGENDPNDMQVLDALTGNSTLVALGENTHGSSEIYRLKNRMIRHMAENMGFGIFSLEAGMSECYRLDEYIHSGIGSPEYLLRTVIGMWIWCTQEMLNLVEWMRVSNQFGHEIACTGFDMQYPGETAAILEAAFAHDGQALQLLGEIDAGLEKALTYSNVNIPQIDPAMAENIVRALSQIESRIGQLPADEAEKAWLRQLVTLQHQYLGQDGLFSRRDRCMAENLLWIKRQKPASRIVVWAHNGHIEKSGGKMGGFLKESLGEEYVNFGFTFYDGKYTGISPGNEERVQDAQRACPGTLEYLLDKLGDPLFILDLKKMREEKSPALTWLDRLRFRHIGAVKVENEFPDRGITEKFDYLVFIRESTPSHPF